MNRRQAIQVVLGLGAATTARVRTESETLTSLWSTSSFWCATCGFWHTSTTERPRLIVNTELPIIYATEFESSAVIK